MEKWLMDSAEFWEVSVTICVFIEVINIYRSAVSYQQACYPSAGGNYKGHVDVLAPTVQELAVLEREAQTSFLHLGYMPNQLFRAF